MELTGLFRTSVTNPTTTSRWRLEALDVLILEESEDGGEVMATAVQLETLARLRFNPTASDDLVNNHSGTKSWLAQSMQPMLNQTTALWQEVEQLERSRSDLSQNRQGEAGVTGQTLQEIQAILKTMQSGLRGVLLR